jgi:hypothetical protein
LSVNGEPQKVSTDVVQNRMGATSENEMLVWTGKNVNIRAAKYGATLEKGGFVIGLPEKGLNQKVVKDAATKF